MRGGALGWACTRAIAVAAVHLCCPQVVALRVSSISPTDSARGTSASTTGALMIAPVSHSLGWRESVGTVARTRQRLVLARARGREPCGWGSARRPLTALRLEGSSLRDWLQAGVLELDLQGSRLSLIHL